VTERAQRQRLAFLKLSIRRSEKILRVESVVRHACRMSKPADGMNATNTSSAIQEWMGAVACGWKTARPRRCPESVCGLQPQNAEH